MIKYGLAVKEHLVHSDFDIVTDEGWNPKELSNDVPTEKTINGKKEYEFSSKINLVIVEGNPWTKEHTDACDKSRTDWNTANPTNKLNLSEKLVFTHSEAKRINKDFHDRTNTAIKAKYPSAVTKEYGEI